MTSTSCSLAFPTTFTANVVVEAASAGKHVVCEKPFARTLQEADEMIEACRQAGVKLMYAEELCFACQSTSVPSSWLISARRLETSS